MVRLVMVRPLDQPQSRHIPELDGIRGIAVLLVLMFHFGSAPLPDSPWNNFLNGFIGFGWIGVDLFFVLSGCLITGILLEAKGSTHYLRTFYMRRALRIFPLYYATLILFFWVMPPLARRLHMFWPRLTSTEQVWYWLHISNIRTAFEPLIYPHVTHLWSLSVEEQFYLVWPLVVLWCSEAGLAWTCGVLILLSLGLRNVPEFQAMGVTHNNFLYRLTPFRIEPLVLGACIPLIIRNPQWLFVARRRMAGVLLGGCCITAFVLITARTTWLHAPLMTRFGYSGIGLTFASSIFFAVTRSGSAHRWTRGLRSPVLMRLGKYSYAMYVIHYPTVGFVKGVVLVAMPKQGWEAVSQLLIIATGVGLTYLLALCTWKWLEQPFLQLKDRFSYADSPAEGSAGLRKLHLATSQTVAQPNNTVTQPDHEPCAPTRTAHAEDSA